MNDSHLLAESALLGTRLLLSSGEHLRGMDFARLTIELQSFDLAAPVIAETAVQPKEAKEDKEFEGFTQARPLRRR